MPHAIITDVATLILHDVVEVGRHGAVPQLRFQRLASGDAVVIAPAGGRVDGRAMLGGLTVIDPGRGVLVRTGQLRVEVRWRAVRERRTALPGTECSVCFGAATPGAPIVACRCESPAHPDCAELLITCPDCGAPADRVVK